MKVNMTQQPKKWVACAGAVALSSLLLVACSDSDNNRSSVSGETTTVVQVLDTHAKMAKAAYDESLSTAQALKTAVDAFLADPTEAKLTAAKEAYKATRKPYQQSEIMRFDTDITQGTNTGNTGLASVDDWEGQVNAWPLDESFIKGIISGSTAITKAALISKNGDMGNDANVTTGVHAIEFLLWGEDTNGTMAGAGMRAANEFSATACGTTNCDRRRTYLQVVTDLLVEDLVAMQAEWDDSARATAGTLVNNFLNRNDGLAYVVAAMKAMATDELASARIGTALKTNDTEEEHDCFSDLSHVAIYYNFQGVRNAFYGRYIAQDGTVTSGPSLADLVKEKSPATFTKIDNALNSIEASMKSILDVGELAVNPIRFDQIIGQPVTGAERVLAQKASDELVALDSIFTDITEMLSLDTVDTSGGSDGD